MQQQVPTANCASRCVQETLPSAGSSSVLVSGTHGAASHGLRWLNVASLLALYASVWTIVRPYPGLVHDARLYALQTAATLNPGVLLQDIFLRYGSQDSFTIFPRLYAPMARAFGIESAATALTLVASIAWLGVGFLLARELSGTRLALMALGLLIAIPGWYGAHDVFQIGEMFLSARLPAEVAALGGLLASLRGIYWLAFGLFAVSALIHPLMAMPMIGLVMLFAVRKYTSPLLAHIAVLAVVLTSSLATFLLPTEQAGDVSEWVSVLESRSAFLFPTQWRLIDWQNHLLILMTLLIGSRTCQDVRIRHLAVSAAWIGAAGVVLASIAASVPEHPALLRAQTWRWVWVASLLAIVMLPQIVRDLWQRGPGSPNRAVAVLVMTAWLLSGSVGGLLALVAFAINTQADKRFAEYSVWANRAAWSALALALASVFVAATQLAAYPLDSNREAMWIQRTVNFVGPTASALIIVVACWLVASSVRNRLGGLALALLAMVASSIAAPRAVRNWSTQSYSGTVYEAFAPWRTIIPQSAEVLWAGDATATWLVLERRSYFSPDQLAGLLYSPGMTPELQRRATALSAFASPDWWTMADLRKEARPKDLTAEILAAACYAPGLDFLVSNTDLGNAVSTVRRPGRELDMYLYDCRAIVQQEAAR